MKPLVFLGSGVSLPTFGDAGSLANLTEALFEEPWARTTSGTWLAKEPSPTDEKPPCQEFLLRMRKLVEDYYFDQRGSRPNYEDLFYLIEQIDDELAWRGNASVEPFREKVKSLCADLCESRKSQYDDPLRSLTGETLIFIQHVIAHKLHTNCPPVGFELLFSPTGLRTSLRKSLSSGERERSATSTGAGLSSPRRNPRRRVQRDRIQYGFGDSEHFGRFTELNKQATFF